MTQSKWQRVFAAILVTAMLVTSLAPAAFAAEQAAPAQQEVRASEVTGVIPGGQFAKIWLGIAPERPGTVTVTAIWDRSNPEQNGLGFFILNEANLAAVVAGQNLRDNNVSAGSTNFFLNGPDNQQGASFRATGGAYTVIVYNDSASDANFTLSVDNGVLVDGSGQVKAVGAPEESATPEATAEDTAEDTEATAAATPTAAVTEAATPEATEATTTTTTTVVAAGPYRGASVKGELAEQYAQHYLGLEPDQRDGDITLRLTFDPRDNQELARRLGFWVLDEQGFRRHQAGQNAGDVAVAAGSRVSTPGEDNVRSASFNASGFGAYTVIVYNNSRVPATYELSVTGGQLIDDSQQTITAQEMVTGVVTVAAPAATTTTGATTDSGAATTGSGVAGQPGGAYTVKSGDTLAIIARDIYGDFRLYEQLCAFNNIADCNIIEVGQVIKLPTREEIGATGTGTTATTAAATPAATVAATPTATTATTTTETTATTTTETTTITATAPVTTTGATTTTTSPTTGGTAAGTIVQVAANNPNFSILSQALEFTGLDATLSGGEFTVFAPTDAAFNDLLATTGLTTDQLLRASELPQILQYHVLSGKVLAEDVTNGMKATTVQGKPVTFEVKDGSVYINGAKVTITDIPATNGVIHAISAVILPPAQ